MDVINTENLCRCYGRRVGIASVDLRVREGEIYGFLGPNGAGKTTTIRILLGLLRATSGRAAIFGQDCWQSSHRIKQDVGYLPGDLRLYPWMTARKALQIVGRIRGRRLATAGYELADRFRLEPGVRVRAMSKGMRQKLGIVLALAHRPRLLILDEPTSGLDPLMQDELASCLRELAADGHTVFFSSHTLREVEQLCNHIAIVREGRVVADEPIDALRARARRTVTLTFADAEASRAAVPPDGLQILDRSGVLWQCELSGPAPPLIRWADQQRLADLTIGQPDLESLFRRFYRRDES